MRNVNRNGNWPVYLLAVLLSPLALAAEAEDQVPVRAISDEEAKEYGLAESFYKKCTVVQDILIATSERVSDHTHLEAAYQFDMIMQSKKYICLHQISLSKIGLKQIIKNYLKHT